MTQTPADWYPDPNDDRQLRYWDGTAWTAHVAAAPASARPTGPTTPDGEPLAGWWWRVLAYVIDSIIISVVANIVSIPAQIQIQRDFMPVMERFNRAIEQNPETPPDFWAFFNDYLDVMQQHAFWLVAPGAIFTVLYWAIFLRWKGATPGKLMLGMRVRLRDQAGRLPWSSIIARMILQFGVIWSVFVIALLTGSVTMYVVWMLATMIMLLDPLWATWDSKRQTLHDKLAATNVVRPR
ncbi:MAG: RDD family protein [Aeromicrobium sp.]